MKIAFYVLAGLFILALGLGWLGGGLYLGVWCCWVLSVVDLIKQCQKGGENLDAMAVALDLLFFFIIGPICNAVAGWGCIFIFGIGFGALGATSEVSYRRRYRWRVAASP